MRKLLIISWFICAVIAAVMNCAPVEAQGCGPTNPNCIVPTAPPGTSNNQAASTAFVQSSIGNAGIFSVISYGADPTGATNSTSALTAAQAAANAYAATTGGAVIYFPCGSYQITAGTFVSSINGVSVVGEDKHCTMINRFNDGGPTLQFSKASGTLAHVSLRNITFQDLSAVSGGAGFGTCANSPYQIVMDGINDLLIQDVTIAYGCGALALQGVINARVLNTDMEVYPIPGASGQNGLGTVFYIGVTANSNIPAKYSSLIYVDNMEIEGGTLAAAKAAIGVRIDGIDGLWFGHTCHIQMAGTAEMQVAHNSTQPMANIIASECLWDITPGIGIQFNGSKQVTNSFFSGRVSAAGNFPAIASNGISVTGTGGLLDTTFDVDIDGFGAGGFVSTASNISNLIIRPRVITNNNLVAGSNAGISIGTVTNLTITGGVVGSDVQVTPNIALGASVDFALVTGVSSRASAGFGITIASGALNVSLVGNDLTNNTSGPLSNSSAGVVKYKGNLGLADSTATVSEGGTGQVSLTANAFLTGNGTSAINQVALTGLVLGNGASAPTAYTGTSCTNQFLTALSAAGTGTCASVSLTANVSGVLPGANGGTGLSTAAIGDIIYASATTPTWSRLADVAVGSVLVSGGVNTAPAWSSSPIIGTSIQAPILKGVADTTYLTGAQLQVAGATNGNKQLLFGFDTTNNFGFFQAIFQGTSNEPLVLNPGGGDVRIGQITQTGSALLSVNGSIAGTGAAIGNITAISGGGLQVGSPTGGDKGSGTLNVASSIWTNGTQGLASKSCLINTANAATGITLTITNGLITGTTTC